MAKKKEKVKSEIYGFYKGYDMKWLKTEVEHPDYYLVAEYEATLKEKENA